MEGFKIRLERKGDQPAINLLQLRNILNEQSDQVLKQSKLLWRIDNEKGEIPGHTIQSIMIASENHLDSGDGAIPESSYYGEDYPEEEKDPNEIVIPKGGIVLIIT